VALAALGCAVATYLTLYQVGLFQRVWEPFFEGGSRTILNSAVARFLPVPDASLGALAYVLEAGCGVLGGRPAGAPRRGSSWPTARSSGCWAWAAWSW